MKLQKAVWTSEPGGESELLNTLVFGKGLGDVPDAGSTEQKQRITMPSVLLDSDLYAFSLDDFDLWLFLPLCCVCTHVCTSAHTHACVYSSQSRMLVFSPVALSFISSRQSLSLCPELTVICLGCLESKPQQTSLVTTPNGHRHLAVYMSAGIWTQVPVLMKQTLTHWDVSPAPWFVFLIIKRKFSN